MALAVFAQASALSAADKPANSRAATDKPVVRPSKSILKKVAMTNENAAAKPAERAAGQPTHTVETRSTSGGHKLIWRSGKPASAPAKLDEEVTQASAHEPADEQPAVQRPKTRRERRNDILRVSAEEPAQDEVRRAAHLQPRRNPTSPPATGGTAGPAADDPFGDDPTGADPTVSDPMAPVDTDLDATSPIIEDETPPAAPDDVPGIDATPDTGVAPVEQPNGIEGTADDAFADDPIPGNGDAAPNGGQFELEQGQKGATGTETCDDDKRECRESFELLQKTTLNRIALDISIAGVEGQDFPCECELGGETFAGRNWNCITYTWKASALCHKPLYFEEVALERYGHSWNPIVQPFVSGAHFFATIPVLPYKMGLTPPQECVYSLGYYRPGNCAPWLVPPIPLSLRAAAFQAAFVGGAIAIIP